MQLFVVTQVHCPPPPPHPIIVSHSLSSPSFLILFELFFSFFLKCATEMNVLFSTRSICRFLLTFHFVFASLIFAHSCPSFCLFPFFFLRKVVISNTSVCPRTTEEAVFNFIDSLIIRYPHFHSTHTHTHAHASISVKSPPVPLRESPPARTHPFPLPSNHH